jgi:hypothetical protein
MSVPAVRQVAAPSAKRSQPAPSSLAAVDTAGGTACASPSPARVLQERLESNLCAAGDTVEFEDKRWPLYLAVPFWLGLSGLLWAAIIASVLALVPHH